MTSTITLDLEMWGASLTEHPEVIASWSDDVNGRPALRLLPRKQEFADEDTWIVPFPDIVMANGTIEFDGLGWSDPPQSNFLGIALRIPTGGAEADTYEAVYFRPFNFRAEDPDRRSHAVQYISHPEHPWFDLRRDHPGVYEQSVVPAPDGDGWFHARIVVEGSHISVFVDGADSPSLVVETLSDRTEGGIGLWVGPGRGGFFANVRITPS